MSTYPTLFKDFDGLTANRNRKFNCLASRGVRKTEICSNSKHIYKFKCDVCKHNFCETPYGIVFLDRWCPKCEQTNLTKMFSDKLKPVPKLNMVKDNQANGMMGQVNANITFKQWVPPPPEYPNINQILEHTNQVPQNINPAQEYSRTNQIPQNINSSPQQGTIFPEPNPQDNFYSPVLKNISTPIAQPIPCDNKPYKLSQHEFVLNSMSLVACVKCNNMNWVSTQQIIDNPGKSTCVCQMYL